MKEHFGLFLETNTLHMKEQRLSKILCSVFKLVNNKTNPESLNECITFNNAVNTKSINARQWGKLYPSPPGSVA